MAKRIWRRGVAALGMTGLDTELITEWAARRCTKTVCGRLLISHLKIL